MPTSFSQPLRKQLVNVNCIEIKVLVGKDMTLLKADVYCNSTNSNLDLQTGSLARRLRVVGEEIFEEACKNKKTSNGVAVTIPGKLNCKKVIHLDIHSEGSWKDKTLKVLRTANTLPGVSSIALPAFGTGAGGHDAKEVANGIFEAIAEFALETGEPNIKQIIITVMEERMGEAFQMAKLQELSPLSPEYREAVGLYQKSGVKDASVAKVEKIDNIILEKRYSERKKVIELREIIAGEKKLWHGTDNDAAQKICNTGFKCGVKVKNARLYGNGTYFAKDASYSFGYMDGTSTGKLILATVLPGRMVDSESKCEPGYGSVRARNGTIFVLFDDSQSFPKYLITFK